MGSTHGRLGLHRLPVLGIRTPSLVIFERHHRLMDRRRKVFVLVPSQLVAGYAQHQPQPRGYYFWTVNRRRAVSLQGTPLSLFSLN